MAYAYVAVLAELPDGQTAIPSEWFAAFPEGARYAADALPDVSEATLMAAAEGAGAAHIKARRG